MSDDEKKQELTDMLLEQHSLRQTVACLEHRQARYLAQVHATGSLLDLGVVPTVEVTLPSADEVVTVLKELEAARGDLQRLEERLSHL